MNWDDVADSLSESGVSIDRSRTPRSVGGGDISAAWQLHTSYGPLFIKTAAASSFDMFDAEACGLRELASANAVRVPEVIAVLKYGDGALLALEWLELSSPSENCARVLGQQLAVQHRHTQAQHGWYRDNTIGLTAQPNTPADSWPEFYRKQRLEHQLRLAADNGHGADLQAAGHTLLDNLDTLFDDYIPDASLLHGDLWGGNWSAVDGRPVTFDPAVYYGDRETDLAMTRLFGGFSSEFYDSYNEAWPLSDGHERRVDLYQLYHVLNHLNLFGRGYLSRAMALFDNLSGN